MGESEPVSTARRAARSRLAAALGVADDGWIEHATKARRAPWRLWRRTARALTACAAMGLAAWLLGAEAVVVVAVVAYAALLAVVPLALAAGAPPPPARPPDWADAVRADALGLSLLAEGHWRRRTWSEVTCHRRVGGVLVRAGGYEALLTNADGAAFLRAVAAARRLAPDLLASGEETPDTALSRVRMTGAPEVARGLSVAEGEEP